MFSRLRGEKLHVFNLILIISDFPHRGALRPSIKQLQSVSRDGSDFLQHSKEMISVSLSVRRSSSHPLLSLWGVSDYVFCQCVCGNLLICTNTDSNAPATAAFLADGWLGCRLMAESAGPQLGAGNIAHYTFSRGGRWGGLIHTAAQHAGVGVIISF